LQKLDFYLIAVLPGLFNDALVSFSLGLFLRSRFHGHSVPIIPRGVSGRPAEQEQQGKLTHHELTQERR
jgi:hypothetical protein